MKSILFISSFPDELNIKDGFYQRVKNIDEKLHDCKRTYLQIGYNKYFKKQVHGFNATLTLYKINFFLGIFTIIRFMLANENIYFHSIHNYKKVLLISWLIRKKNVIIDLHGVVPEETEFKGQRFNALIFKFVEKVAFKQARSLIFVTDAMRQYYTIKYPFVKSKNLLNYAIFTSNVFDKNMDGNDISSIYKKYDINIKNVVLIYSGNTQKWQNIGLMLDSMRRLLNAHDNVTIIILTMETEEFKKHIAGMDMDTRNIKVTSVNPEDLGFYYSISHYGFILRDDHILNRVACPTKMVEYLYYGIIPIVKCSDIGDFKKLGYEYKMINEIEDGLEKVKSDKNIEVARKLLKQNSKTDIHSVLM